MNKKIIKKICIALVAAVLMTLMAVPVYADNVNTTTIRLKGRTYYLVTEYNRAYNTRSRLLQKTSKGNKAVAVTKYSGQQRMEYVGTYGNKIYFNYAYGKTLRTYTYTVGKQGFKLETGGLYLEGIRGRYAYGYTWVPEDNTPRKLCVYDLAAKATTYIGLGYFSDSNYINGKIYYVRYSNQYRTAYIMRCNPDGTGKKILKTLKSRYPMYSFTVEKNRADYYIDRNNRYYAKSVRY